MDAQIETHLPLITARLIFAPKVFHPPPTITPRMEFPSIILEEREHSPTPDIRRATTPVQRATTPVRRATTPVQRATTPVRRATTPPKRVRISEAPSKGVQRGASPGHSTIGDAIEVEFIMSDDDEIMGDDDDEEASEDEEATGSEGIRKGLIPKPKGDVSRPGRGGYNLSKALGWNQKTYDSVLSVVTKLAKEKLDTSKSYCGQSKRKVHQLLETVHKEFSFLKDYEKDWPVHDMLKTYLKNSSQTARNTKGRETTEEIEKVRNYI
ncbi:hypothetical protein CVT25_014355 [Psilocybe cyanescens]|uniref:Uncharacterized protein n=1 Tax=Psilocybe cyanescens TaxID=93625 RepID=A0A409WU82_PSICY|nr:hypothetical protein CVT25_014355 [Psilocybe cyanescens]